MSPASPVRASRFVGAAPRIRVSFEFFPPKSEEMERTLWDRSPGLPRSRPASSR